jgi:hypothetical protein
VIRGSETPTAKAHKAPIPPFAIPSIMTARAFSRRRGASRLLLVIREPCAFGRREAFRSLSGLKAQDGLVVVDGDNDRVSCCPRRIVSRRYFDAERHSLFPRFGRHSAGEGGESDSGLSEQRRDAQLRSIWNRKPRRHQLFAGALWPPLMLVYHWKIDRIRLQEVRK